MADFTKLVRALCTDLEEGERREMPFVVELANKEKVLANFQGATHGKDVNCLLTHITCIWVCDASGKVTKIPVSVDAPARLSHKPTMECNVYMSCLEKIYDNYSEEKMDALLHCCELEMLVASYRAVREYVKVYFS